MSQISVDSVIPQSGTTITVGASGDTVNLGSGASTNGFLPSAISVSGTDFQFNSGYGSVATAYGIRAWVDYNGDTNTINASGNISSVTDNATGNFTVNFSTAMPDTYYGLGYWVKDGTTVAVNRVCMANSAATLTTSAVQVYVYATALFDPEKLTICVYR